MMSNRSAVFAQEFASYAAVILSFREVVQYIHADLCSRGFHVGFRCGKPFRSEIDWYIPEGPIVFIYPYSGTNEHPLVKTRGTLVLKQLSQQKGQVLQSHIQF